MVLGVVLGPYTKKLLSSNRAYSVFMGFFWAAYVPLKRPVGFGALFLKAQWW